MTHSCVSEMKQKWQLPRVAFATRGTPQPLKQKMGMAHYLSP